MVKGKKVSPEFMEAILKFQDCPEDLFKMAKSDFEKATAIEFFGLSTRLEKVDKDLEWIKYIVKAIFGVTLVAVIAQVASYCW